VGKKKSKVSRGAQQRERVNPLTGQTETVSGTKAGKKRVRLPFGNPLRTHDLHGPVDKRKSKKNKKSEED
jgi:hypothetical protein